MNPMDRPFHQLASDMGDLTLNYLRDAWNDPKAREDEELQKELFKLLDSISVRVYTLRIMYGLPPIER